MIDEEAIRHHRGTPAFESSTGFLLSRLGSLAARSWVGMLNRFDLTPHQHGVLLLLREQHAVSQRDLLRSIAVDPRNVLPILDGLVERGYLDRAIDANDRRMRRLTLTAHGRDIAEDLAAAATEIEREFLAGLPASEQQSLNRLLRTLLDSLI